MANHKDETVRAQYEAYPYPARNPADESKRLVTGSPSHLAEINHYVFGGTRDFGRGAAPFRALVAGGGTGDGAIMLAQHLADAGGDSEVVHLDISKASADVARARAKARKLTNIRFVKGSLLDLESLDLGSFDYIDCCGVLHHLAEPDEGLGSLVASLKPDGGMGLMVYAELGRTGVYHIQQALRLMTAESAQKEQIKAAHALLADLPDSNWLKRNPWVADHLHGDDAGLYDLLLHSRDRAYRVLDVFDLVESAGLAVSAFIEPARYDPATYLRDEDLLRKAHGLAWPEACALAELLAGSIKRHVFYVARGSARNRVATPDTPSVVPILRDGDGPALAQGLATTRRLNADLEGLSVSYALDKLVPAIVSRVDGERNLADIHAAMTTDISWDDFFAAFKELYGKLNGINVMLLRRPKP